jgi:hypothetical protein
MLFALPHSADATLKITIDPSTNQEDLAHAPSRRSPSCHRGVCTSLRAMNSQLIIPVDNDWPETPVPNTAAWEMRCFAQIVIRDGGLDPVDAASIAKDMSTERRWRRLHPEDAVDQLFDMFEDLTLRKKPDAETDHGKN